jgi:transmembrane sensor
MRPEPQLENVREEAAAWHDRLHRDKMSDEIQSAFEAWFAESAEHRTAYASVDKAWAELQIAALDPQILVLRHETAFRLTRRTSEAIRPLRWAAATVALLVVGGAALTLSARLSSDHSLTAWLLEPLSEWNSRVYVTATGERLAFTLRDGSQVTLDTQTELKVAFTASERAVRLIRGRAYFEVAKDHNRPFVVETQDRRFVAVGTAFDVRVDGEQVRVTMVEGTVRVERHDESGTAAIEKPSAAQGESSSEGTATVTTRREEEATRTTVVTITAGQQLIADASLPDEVRAADPERSTSWRRGQIIFDNTRLGDAITELNRYSEAKIELADPALADLRLSGAFATGRPTLFIEALTSYFPVQVSRADDKRVVLSARK